jgi:GrpB-like predicted nucleotidyltransferase (UPF0157 family)
MPGAREGSPGHSYWPPIRKGYTYHSEVLLLPLEALGLLSGEARVVPWDPRWPALFEDAAKQLIAHLGPSIIAVHHVGSTAVPGLCAKPILDILVSVADIKPVISLLLQVEALGYEYRPDREIPERRFFRRPRGGHVRTHHLSFAEPGSRFHKVTLAFRDALRSNARLSAEYARLKQDLARRFPNDRLAYIEGKSEFVLGVLASCGLD